MIVILVAKWKGHVVITLHSPFFLLACSIDLIFLKNFGTFSIYLNKEFDGLSVVASLAGQEWA